MVLQRPSIISAELKEVLLLLSRYLPSICWCYSCIWYMGILASTKWRVVLRGQFKDLVKFCQYDAWPLKNHFPSDSWNGPSKTKLFYCYHDTSHHFVDASLVSDIWMSWLYQHQQNGGWYRDGSSKTWFSFADMILDHRRTIFPQIRETVLQRWSILLAELNQIILLLLQDLPSLCWC